MYICVKNGVRKKSMEEEAGTKTRKNKNAVREDKN